MLVELDNSLGDFVSLLKQLDYWSNTYILATTDNGGMTDWLEDASGKPQFPASIGSNFPLRAGKTTLFEGGTKGTAFLAGGALPEESRGTSWHDLMHAVDLSTTAMGFAGAESPSNADGLDFSRAALDPNVEKP